MPLDAIYLPHRPAAHQRPLTLTYRGECIYKGDLRKNGRRPHLKGGLGGKALQFWIFRKKGGGRDCVQVANVPHPKPQLPKGVPLDCGVVLRGLLILLHIVLCTSSSFLCTSSSFKMIWSKKKKLEKSVWGSP